MSLLRYVQAVGQLGEQLHRLLEAKCTIAGRFPHHFHRVCEWQPIKPAPSSILLRITTIHRPNAAIRERVGDSPILVLPWPSLEDGEIEI